MKLDNGYNFEGVTPEAGKAVEGKAVEGEKNRDLFPSPSELRKWDTHLRDSNLLLTQETMNKALQSFLKKLRE